MASITDMFSSEDEMREIERYKPRPNASAFRSTALSDISRRAPGQADAAQRRKSERVIPTFIKPTMATAAQADTSQQAQFRGDQRSLVQQIQDTLAGRGTSVAQQQLNQSTDRTMAAALAMARSSGANPGLAMRQAGFQQANALQQAAGQGALLRAQEQQAARSLLADVIGQGRQQDIGLAFGQAGFQQEANLANQAAAMRAALANQGAGLQAGMANQDAALRQQHLNDQMTAYYTSLGYSAEQAQFMAAQELERLRAHIGLGMVNAASGVQQGQQRFEQTLAGALIGGAAQGLGYAAVKGGTK